VATWERVPAGDRRAGVQQRPCRGLEVPDARCAVGVGRAPGLGGLVATQRFLIGSFGAARCGNRPSGLSVWNPN
jgi:hypothetical protein